MTSLSDRERARRVREMFAGVVARYDFLNHFLSLNMDRWWRRRTARRLREPLRRPGARVLDLCCGTGDLALALERERQGPVLASDFCHPMLLEAKRKFAAQGSRSLLFEADALALPIASQSLDVVAVAFGFRNLADYGAGLAEMRRLLRPGGLAAILEFSHPPNPLLAACYHFYSRRVLPVLGGLISGSPEAYAYLPDSVRRFPSPEQLAAEMQSAGFAQVEFERMTGGIVALHLGRA